MGCAFFGVPFRGSDMAKIALLYSNIFGNEAYESLLSSMRTEPNDILDEVTNDFMEISSKLVPPIDLFCAWEQVPTDVSYYEWAAQKIPNLLQHKFFKAGARKFMEVGIPALGAGTVSKNSLSKRKTLIEIAAFCRDGIRCIARSSQRWIDCRS